MAAANGLLIVAPPIVLGLSCVSFLILAMVWAINKNPNLVAKGQDAAGRGMAVGCLSILMVSVVVLIGAMNAVLAWKFTDPSVMMRIIGSAPLGVVLLLGAVAFILYQVQQSRAERERWEREMAVPLFVLIDTDDRVLSATYEALRTTYPTTDMNLRQPGAFHWQLAETLPRAKIICLCADVEPDPARPDLENDSKTVIEDLARCRAVCPVLLYSRDLERAEPLAAQLRSAGWTVEVVDAAGDNWIASRFLPQATELLGSFHESPLRNSAPSD